ncbi:MAG: hypothetical protein H0U49_05570, partial [Parachlamydiaceae bacterium]|nr:hypothetical protein [Parachlamydiaceae bacterium]
MHTVESNLGINRHLTTPKSFENTGTRKKHVRKVQLIQPSQKAWINAETLKSVFAITIIACLIFGVFIPSVGASTLKSRESISLSNSKAVCKNPQFYAPVQSNLQPYNSQPKPLFGNNYCPKPIETFHPAIPKVMHAGKMKGLDRILCVIPEKMPTFKECKEVAEMMDGLVKKRFPKKYSEAMTKKDSEKGLPIHSPTDIGYSIKSVYVGTNPQKELNYRNALSYLEDTVLKNPSFFEKSDAEVVASIMKTNELVEKKLSRAPGKLRKDFSFILDDQTSGVEGLRSLLIKKGGSSKDLKIFDKFFSKRVTGITDEQARVLRMISFLPTLPDAVESEMLILAREI